MLRLVVSSMLYYTLEEGEMEPNGTLSKEKLEGQDEQNTEQS